MTLVEAPPRLSSALRVERWLLAPAPATRLAALRVLIGGYGVVHLLATAPSLLQIARLPASQLAPVGVLSWLPGPLPEAAVSVGLALAVVTGVAFVLGAGWRVSGPLFAVHVWAAAGGAARVASAATATIARPHTRKPDLFIAHLRQSWSG